MRYCFLARKVLVSRPRKDYSQRVDRNAYLFDNGTNHSKGVAILINSDPKIDIISTFIKSEGRIKATRLSINELCYFLLNVYAPAKKSEKELFHKMLFKLVE